MWTRRPEAAETLAEAHGTRAASSAEALFEQVDAVAFAVPPGVQAALAPAAAHAGRHLLLEKPLALDVAGASAIADAAREAGVATLLMLTRRFGSEVREWLDELHEVGGWTGGAGRWLAGGLLSGDYADSPWRQQHGSLLDSGPHAIDLLEAALGDIERVRCAQHGTPDLWHLMFGHASGATSTLALSLRMPVQPALVDFAVYGEHGYRPLSSRRTTAQTCYRRMLDEFLTLVEGGHTEHPCDAQRGLRLQQVLALCQDAGMTPEAQLFE